MIVKNLNFSCPKKGRKMTKRDPEPTLRALNVTFWIRTREPLPNLLDPYGKRLLMPYIKYFWCGFRSTSLADRRVSLWPTSWKWRSRRLTFHTGDRWRRTIPTTDKLFCTNTETVSGRVQNGRPGKTTAGGDKHQGSAFLRSYLPLMLRTSHFTKQFICSTSIATYY